MLDFHTLTVPGRAHIGLCKRPKRSNNFPAARNTPGFSKIVLSQKTNLAVVCVRSHSLPWVMIIGKILPAPVSYLFRKNLKLCCIFSALLQVPERNIVSLITHADISKHRIEWLGIKMLFKCIIFSKVQVTTVHPTCIYIYIYSNRLA